MRPIESSSEQNNTNTQNRNSNVNNLTRRETAQTSSISLQDLSFLSEFMKPEIANDIFNQE